MLKMALKLLILFYVAILVSEYFNIRFSLVCVYKFNIHHFNSNIMIK
jgi:hypothetical protein